MPKARTVFFTAPKQIEIRETSLPPLKENEVLVETSFSAISAGTEMLVYRGQFPRLADAHDRVSSDLNYPLAYGYACVGQVKEVGKLVDGRWRDRSVFSFQPHISHFITTPDFLIPIPEGISFETACFLPGVETAVNLVQDGAPILGERVLVFGQGVVGLLTASLLNEFPVKCLVTADYYKLRREALNNKSHPSLDPATGDFLEQGKSFLGSGADLTFELSGSPSALNDAIALTTFSGRIIIGSWYGEKRADINLGGAFHRSRIKLISSQVSTIAPELTERWDKARRFEIAWEALKRIQPQKWITHRFSLEESKQAYQLLDENPQDTIQVIFEYPS